MNQGSQIKGLKAAGGPPAPADAWTFDCAISNDDGKHAARNVLNNSLSRKTRSGEDLAGTGALVFEGEVLDLPRWH